MLALTPGLLAGCGKGMENGGQDVDMISERPSKLPDQPKGSGPLWPLTPGKTWRTLTLRPNAANANSEIRVAGTRKMPDGRSGTLVQSFRNGKLFRVEVYQAEPSGALKLMALGENEKKMLSFTPAIPVLGAPTKEGQSYQWNGTARIDGKDYPATAFHRLSAVETVKTPFDSYRTFRLDGIVTLLNGNQRIDYPAVMWFVPGKGIA
ncbi:MAG: hypothetical protein EON58_22215, partial [Alphaproteobacteria bacterium]